MPDSPIPNESDSINTVSVKLPPFWPDQPLVWFAQAESQFALRNIVLTKTKYYHVTAVLPQEVALSVLDILREPPTVEPYETLKKRLVQSFDLTDYQRAEQFAKLPSLGDRRPSELMNTMLSLLPSNHSPCFFFKYNFLQRLPPDIRGHLVTQSIENVRDLADLADKLCVARQQDVLTASITSVPGATYEMDEIAVVRNQYKRQPPHSSQHTSVDLSICWFHRKWGDKATSCRKPCTFQAAGNGQVGRSY